MAVKKVVFLIVLVLGLSVVMPVCRAQGIENQSATTFSGVVVSVDIDKSTVTVESSMTIVFPISPDTKLTKDIYGISLSGIKVGDYVTVGYYEGDEGPSKVLSLSVEYLKNQS